MSFITGQDLFMLITATVEDPDLPADQLSVSIDLSNINGPPVLEMFDDGEGPGLYVGGLFFSAPDSGDSYLGLTALYSRAWGPAG